MLCRHHLPLLLIVFLCAGRVVAHESRTHLGDEADPEHREAIVHFHKTRSYSFNNGLLVLRGSPKEHVTDADWRHLKNLDGIEQLWINLPLADDADLANIARSKFASSIRELDLHGTFLGGTGLEHVAALTALESVSFGPGTLEADSLAHLKQLPALKRLSFYETEISDADLAHVADIESLESLTLSRMRLKEATLKHVGKVVGLRELQLHGTFNDDALAALAGLENIETLILSSPNVTTLAPLRGMAGLRSLSLSATPISVDGFAALPELEHLEKLMVRLRADTSAGLVHIGRIPQLQTLELSGGTITDADVAHLVGATRLQVLKLDRTPITSAGLEHLSDIQTLVHLDLEDTAVGDAGIAHVANLTRLEILNVRRTGVSDAGLAHMARLARLRHFNAIDSGVTREGERRLEHMLPTVQIAVDAPP